MERKQGYYFVKYMGNWSIAYYSPKYKAWNSMEYFGTFSDSSFEEINENQILPPE